MEECGCRLTALAHFADYVSMLEGRRDTISLYRAVTADAPRADAREIAEAAMFALDSLPENVSPATLRRLAEAAGEDRADSW